VIAVIGAILGYPIYNLFRLSLQRYGLFELLRHQGVSVGLATPRTILGRPGRVKQKTQDVVVAMSCGALDVVVGRFVLGLVVVHRSRSVVHVPGRVVHGLGCRCPPDSGRF